MTSPTTITTYARIPDVADLEYDPDKDILTRQSTIGQFQMCPKRVGLDGQPGHLAMVSEKLAFGQCFHSLAAADLERGEPVMDMLSDMSWVDELLKEEYDWSLAQVPDPQGFFGELSIAYREWRQIVRPTIKDKDIVGVEEDAYLYLGEGRGEGVRIFLKGTPDVAVKSELLDWKTTGQKYDQGKVDVSIQASLYLPLAKLAWDWTGKKFSFWVYYRPKGTWEKWVTKRTVAQINSAMGTAYDYGLQIESGIFPATPVPENFKKKRGWYCAPKWCGAWNICPAKELGDGVDTKQVAIRSWQ